MYYDCLPICMQKGRPIICGYIFPEPRKYCQKTNPSKFFFNCGRRPVALLATMVVVGVVVWGGGGGELYAWAFVESMYGFEKIESKSQHFSF